MWMERGDFNRLRSSGDELEATGWILHPEVPAETLADLRRRPGRRRGSAIRARGRRSRVPLDCSRKPLRIPFPAAVPAEALSRSRSSALSGRKQLARIRAVMDPEFEQLPVPGPALLSRILPSPDPLLYQASGLFSYACFLDALSGRVDMSTCTANARLGLWQREVVEALPRDPARSGSLRVRHRRGIRGVVPSEPRRGPVQSHRPAPAASIPRPLLSARDRLLRLHPPESRDAAGMARGDGPGHRAGRNPPRDGSWIARRELRFPDTREIALGQASRPPHAPRPS